MKAAIPIVIAALLIVSGCNVLQEEDPPPVISASVLPTTAGSVLISGQGSEDQQVELLAVANDNWYFSNWSGDIESDENPLNITLTENTEIFANFVLSGNDFQVNVQVTDGQSSTDLFLGQVQEATDGYDTDIDLEGPPPPPDDVLYAWIEGNERSLLRDFRNPYSNSAEWIVIIDPGNSELINLSWDLEFENISGTLLLTDSDESVNINMLEVNSHDLRIEERDHIRITYSSGD